MPTFLKSNFLTCFNRRRTINKLSLCKIWMFTSQMKVFTQHLNPITGQNEWNLQQEDYDYKQEIARSSYADMLHDKERNDLYYEGIRLCIAHLRSQRKEIHVLDIGTGTGLLSMMALSCGVDSVTACEAFSPMSECAKEILTINGLIDKVNLIGKRSTELECGEGKEMPQRANLLITEVFDTELIGEGAIETFSHARQHLLTPDALTVPSEATIFAQVVSSSLVRGWNKITPISLPLANGKLKKLLTIPDAIESCPGAAAVHDIQLSQLSLESFDPISEPLPVFEFDWSGRTIDLAKRRTSRRDFRCLTSGLCDAVFMWWTLKMDPLGEVVLSCAPIWEHPLTKGKPEACSSKIPWRDHWMQAVYYPPRALEVNEGDGLILSSSHDEYSLWFEVTKDLTVTTSPERPICQCLLHTSMSRTRLAQLSDPRRMSLYLRVLERHVRQDTVCLFLGDGCLISVLAAKFGAKHVYIHETNGFLQQILNAFIQTNRVQDRITVLSSPLSEISMDKLIGPVSLVFSEPHFDTSLLPWHSIHFLYRLKSAQHLLSTDPIILPSLLTIRAIPVEFRDLWKIRAPLGTCCGFKMAPFDEMIDKACDDVDQMVEPQPLWEYPCTALAAPVTLLSLPLSLRTLDEPQSSKSASVMESKGTLNGLALWSEWHFQSGEYISTGPIDDVTPKKEVVWDMASRQGVHLFKSRFESSTPERTHRIDSSTWFESSTGSVHFEFQVSAK